MKKYILTGGPGSGKSSIILALERLGEYTVRETAEDYIRLRQAQGVKEPWTEKDFQEEILKMQLKREEKIPKEVKRAWLDRSGIDGLAYAKPGTKTYETIKRETKRRHYDGVFLIETFGSCQRTEIRRESYVESVRIGEKLKQIYESLGYRVERVKPGTIEERLKQILTKIK